MNDDIEKINAQNRALNKPSEGNQSRAAFSNITTNEQDSKNSMAQNIILDLGNQRIDIDFLKETSKKTLDDLELIKIALNQITEALNKTVQPAENQKGLNLENITAIGELLQKGSEAWKNIKGPAQAAPSFIDPEYINEQVKASVMGNFEIGNALISNLKSKLINKAVTASVTEALNDDKHAPQ